MQAVSLKLTKQGQQWLWRWGDDTRTLSAHSGCVVCMSVSWEDSDPCNSTVALLYQNPTDIRAGRGRPCTHRKPSCFQVVP
jgi:hypothetical protein